MYKEALALGLGDSPIGRFRSHPSCWQGLAAGGAWHQRLLRASAQRLLLGKGALKPRFASTAVNLPTIQRPPGGVPCAADSNRCSHFGQSEQLPPNNKLLTDEGVLLRAELLLEASRQLRQQSSEGCGHGDSRSRPTADSQQQPTARATGLRTAEGWTGTVSTPGHPASPLSPSWSQHSPREPGGSGQHALPLAPPDGPCLITASFGRLAAASAATAARLTDTRFPAASSPTTTQHSGTSDSNSTTSSNSSNTRGKNMTSARRDGITPQQLSGPTTSAVAAAAAAVAAAAAAVSPAAAALADPATAAPSSSSPPSSSPWLAVEALLREAAYSLSQELPDINTSAGPLEATGGSPPEALVAAAAAAASAAATDGGAAGQLLGAVNSRGSDTLAGAADAAVVADTPPDLQLLGEGLLSAPPTAQPGLDADWPGRLLPPADLAGLPPVLPRDPWEGLAAAAGDVLAAAKPGADRLNQMVYELLYSLSQDIDLTALQKGEDLAAAGQAVVASAAAAAAELPRAAATALYQSVWGVWEQKHLAAAAPEAVGTTAPAAAASSSASPSVAAAIVVSGGGGALPGNLYGDGSSGGGGDVTVDPHVATALPLEVVSPDSTAATAAAAAAAPNPLLPPGPMPLDPSRGMDATTAAADSAEAAVGDLTEAVQRELMAAVAAARSVGVELGSADPGALIQSLLQVSSPPLEPLLPSLEALDSLDPTALPADNMRLSSLLGATLQSCISLVDAALSRVQATDSLVVGGVALAAVLALLIRAVVVSLAAAPEDPSREGDEEGEEEGDEEGDAAADGARGGGTLLGPGGLRDWLRRGSQGAADGGSSPPSVGVTALEAAGVLNNDPGALLVDIRSRLEVAAQGIPDLRPFRRGEGAARVALPYIVPPLRPSQLAAITSSSTRLGGGGGAGGVAGDPSFVPRVKELVAGLGPDCRLFLMDSSGAQAPGAVQLLRSDTELVRLMGGAEQGVTFVEGGFAGPEGWKSSGVPVTAPPAPEGPSGELPSRQRPSAVPPLPPGQQPLRESGGLPEGGGGGGAAAEGLGRQLRTSPLLPRVLAVGAVGSAGAAAAASLDWSAIGRGAVGLAAALLLADRVLPPGMRPSGRIRRYLEVQMDASQDPDVAAPGDDDDASRRRRCRTALLLRALDLAEAVGDLVVRAGGAAVAAAGSSAARTAAMRASSAPAAATPVSTAGGRQGRLPVVEGGDTLSAAASTASMPPGDRGAATAAEQQQPAPQLMTQKYWDTATTVETAAATASADAPVPVTSPPPPSPPPPPQQPPPPPQQQPQALASRETCATTIPAIPEPLQPPAPPSNTSSSPAGRRPGTALHKLAADRVVVRAASSGVDSGGGGGGAGSGGDGGSSSPSKSSKRAPDTLNLMTALAAASALSSTTLPGAGVPGSGLPPGWPAAVFPRASAGQRRVGSSGATAAGAVPERLAAGPWLEAKAVATAAGTRKAESAGAAAAAMAEEVAAGASVSNSGSSRQAGDTGGSAPVAASPVASSSADVTVRDGYQRQQQQPYTPAPGPAPDSARSRTTQQWRELDNDAEPPLSTALATVRGPTARWTCAPPSPPSSPPAAAAGHPRNGSHLLHTSSPERAAATGRVPLQRLRLAAADRDDDGLGSGVYGSDVIIAAGSLDVDRSDGKGREKEHRGQLLRTGTTAVVVADGGISAVTARMQQHQPRHPNSREASQQRVAEAAAAMRQLRRETGLAPTDGGEGSEEEQATDTRLATAYGYHNSDIPRGGLTARAPADWRAHIETSMGV